MTGQREPLGLWRESLFC